MKLLRDLFRIFLTPPFGNPHFPSYTSYLMWWAWLAFAGYCGWWLEPRIFP